MILERMNYNEPMKAERIVSASDMAVLVFTAWHRNPASQSAQAARIGQCAGDSLMAVLASRTWEFLLLR